MKDFTLRQLEYLVAVADHGTLRAAADHAHVSAATMSQALTTLERALGMQLLQRRSAKGSTLTTAGQYAVRNARHIIAEADTLSHLGAQMSGEVFGTIRLGCYTTLSPWLLPRLAARFRERYPGAELQFEDAPGAGLADAVADGRLDAVLTFRRHARRVDVIRLPLLECGVVAVLPADHPLAVRPSLALDDLSPMPAVVLDTSTGVDLVAEVMGTAGLIHHPLVRSHQFETVRSLVARGFGYSLTMGLPYPSVSHDGLPLVYRPVVAHGVDNPVEMLLPRAARRSATVLALIDECRDILSALQGADPGL